MLPRRRTGSRRTTRKPPRSQFAPGAVLRRYQHMRLGVVLQVLVLDPSPKVIDVGPELQDAVTRRRKMAAASTPAPALDLEGTYFEAPHPRLVHARGRDA